MYLLNLMAHLIKITILLFILLNKVKAKNYDKQISMNNDTDFEFINSIVSNQNDSKKSDNLHILTRIYQRLHDLHNRHHHHHLHHISSAASDNILDRPFRLFDRQTDHRIGDFNDEYHRPMFNRPIGGANGGGFNGGRQFGNRPWLRRQKRSTDDDGLDNYLDQLNYDKKLKSNSIKNKSDYNDQFDRNYAFKPISAYKSNKLLSQSINLSNRSTFIHNHLKPSFNDLSPTKSLSKNYKYYPSTTTPSSNSPYLTTSFLNNNQNNYNLFNPLHRNSFSLYNSIDNSYNLYQYESTHHHYYHQAYLLYKYFKLYKDKSISEINWSQLPDEIRDKFKMLILSLRYIQNLKNNNSQHALSNLSEDYVISKALEIVKWKGWNSQPQQKSSKKEFDNNIKPIFPIQYTNRLIDQQSVNHLINQPINIKNSQIKGNIIYDNYKQPTTTATSVNHLNIIDQIDDIDSYSNNYHESISLTAATPTTSTSTTTTTTTTTTTVKPLTTTMSTNEALKKAFENIEDIRTNHSCSNPKGKLFNLKEINHDYRFYLPKCVYLHKCDDSTGCCAGQKHCVASEQKIITKYFYNLSSDKRQSRVVRLEFVNDTKCECTELDTNFHYQQTDLIKNELNNNQLKSNTYKSINHYLIRPIDVNKYYNKSLSQKQIIFGKNDNFDSGIL